jgi:hypothetical protein
MDETAKEKRGGQLQHNMLLHRRAGAIGCQDAGFTGLSCEGLQ